MLPIVLIHGFPLDGTMWRAQAEFLRGRGHEVLTPDLPGFGAEGLKTPRRQAATMEGYAAEVAHQLMRRAGRFIVGGFSMGGYVLLALLKMHPELVGGAMFIDTRAEADSAEGKMNRLKSIEEMEKNGTGNLIDGLCTRLFRKNPDPAVLGESRSIMERQSLDAVAAAQWAMAHRRDQMDLLHTLTMPALMVVGEEDIITPPASAEAMRSRLPRATVAVIPNAGHMAPMEQPDAVNAAIGKFIASVR